MERLFDVVIAGGGIHGCAVARDAAMRGLSVLLCEQGDPGGKTSSASSKLVHGGLRYLEHYNPKLVYESMKERRLLAINAPHLVRPMPFLLPHAPEIRKIWQLRLGMFVYNRLSRGRQFPRARYIAQDEQYFSSLQEKYQHGFLYYDCIADDARLVITNAIAAREHGALIMPRTRLLHAQVVNNIWQLTLQAHDNHIFQVNSKSMINATGPWVNEVSKILRVGEQHQLRHVKGSHIVVPKLYEGDHACILQHTDKRIIFTIPWQKRTLIGTTDVDFTTSLLHIHIDVEEIDYLLDITNTYFRKKLDRQDILHHWSGVRPLIHQENRSASTVSRDYAYHYQDFPAPIVTIYGGKLTTHRRVAEQVVDALGTVFPRMSACRTARTPLPGSATNNLNYEQYCKHAHQKYHWLPDKILAHYLANYGTRTENILKNCRSLEDLGLAFTDILYQAEVDYLVREEWAMSIDDILWRRTRIGLDADTAATGEVTLAEYLAGLLADKNPTASV